MIESPIKIRGCTLRYFYEHAGSTWLNVEDFLSVFRVNYAEIEKYIPECSKRYLYDELYAPASVILAIVVLTEGLP